jgi:glycosyltransferase involved in cell wall biosynthesis
MGNMKIGIDCSAVPGARTGVGEYTYNLVQALSRIDKVNSYVLYPFFYHLINPDYNNADLPATDNFCVDRRPPAFPILLQRFVHLAGRTLFTEEMLGDVDIVHSTTFCAPRFKDGHKRLVVTIYDLTVITHPECHKKLNIRHCKKGIEDAVRYADAIIAISEHTKKDLVNIAGAPEDLVHVTPLAADPGLGPVKERAVLDKVRKKYGLPGRYVLFLGSLEPRKNVATLIRAYAALPAEIKDEVRLVIAGAKGWMNSPVHDTLDKLGLLDRTTFTGYVDRADLSALYSMAECFVYPSLYEGFGLPVLEAMACATPVVTSNTSSMPEVAGSAARLIDPLDHARLAGILEEILKSKDLQKDMIRKGLRQAAMFSWERCAAETLEVYEKVYKNPRRRAQ